MILWCLCVLLRGVMICKFSLMGVFMDGSASIVPPRRWVKLKQETMADVQHGTLMFTRSFTKAKKLLSACAAELLKFVDF